MNLIKKSRFTPKSRSELKTALDLWCSDEKTAVDTYGILKNWDVGSVTDMGDVLSDLLEKNRELEAKVVEQSVNSIEKQLRTLYVKGNGKVSKEISDQMRKVAHLYTNPYQIQQLLSGQGPPISHPYWGNIKQQFAPSLLTKQDKLNLTKQDKLNLTERLQGGSDRQLGKEYRSNNMGDG